MPGTVGAVLALAGVAVILRTLPPLGLLPWPPGPTHLGAALAWAAAFLLWLRAYWPVLSAPNLPGSEPGGCGRHPSKGK